MTDYAYDLHPRDDPRDGAAIIRYTAEDLIAAEFRDAIGVGSGQGIIWHDHDGAENIDSRGEQYVRVVRLGGTEKVVGGFWTSKLPFETAVASERRHLTFSGPGQMAYLARARMAPHTYIHDVFTGQDPFDGMWRLSAQSTIFANGPYLGAMLWRVIYEAQHFRSGSSTYTHRHADGLEYTDNHDDDRTVSRIPDLVLGFDQFEDSNGNDWTLTAGEFTAQVGESVLGVVQRLMQAGLSVWMDPDTFTLYAWEGRPSTKLGRSTDRTGAAWGTGVVRFQSPTDGTRATGNILSDANRVVNAYLPQGPIWVGGNDVYHKEDGPSDALYEGFVASTVEDLDALAQIGAVQSTAREEAADVGDLHHRLGDSPSTGAYLPGEHYLLDELVRINTGSGEFDYTEANYPVAAWRVSLAAGAAQWEAFAELGASFQEGRERQFTIPSNPGHTHPPNPPLCTTQLETGESATLYEEWDNDPTRETEAAHPGDLAIGSGSFVWGVGNTGLGTPGGGAESSANYTRLEHDTGSQDVAATAGTLYRFTGYLWEFNNDIRIEVRWFNSAGSLLQTDLIVHRSNWPAAWTLWSGDATAPTGATNMQLRAQTGASGGVGATCWIDNVRIYTISAGSSGPGLDEYTGSSNEAARCDHGHDHNDLFNRNAAEAHPASSVTYDNSITNSSATTVQERLDELGDAEGGEIDHGSLSGLVDDDHPQYVRTTDGGKEVINVVAASGSTETLDLADGNVHDVTLTDDCTLTLDGATNGVACHMAILLRQGSGAPHLVTWPASVEWVGGSAPTLQTAEDAWDWVALVTLDGGTTWYAQHAGTSSGASSSSRGAILLASDHSVPFTFDEILQASDGSDFLYASE